MSNVQKIPAGAHTITPHLVCADATAAIDFYHRAFNAVEMMRLPGPEGKLMHAALRIGNSNIMLVDEMPAWGALGPLALTGTPVTLHLYVEDADATFAQAVAHGASAKMPMTDMFWGDRYGMVIDPYGHQWAIATHIRDVSPQELNEFAGKMCQENCPSNA